MVRPGAPTEAHSSRTQMTALTQRSVDVKGRKTHHHHPKTGGGGGSGETSGKGPEVGVE